MLKDAQKSARADFCPPLPTAEGIIAQVRQRLTAERAVGVDAAAKTVADAVALADTAGAIDVGVRLLVGDFLNQVKAESKHGEFVKALEKHGFTKQKAHIYTKVASALGKSPRARTFAQSLGWSKIQEVVAKLDDNDIADLVAGKMVGTFKADALVAMPLQQLKLAFAESEHPRIAKLANANKKATEDIRMLEHENEQLHKENAGYKGSTVAESKARGFDIHLSDIKTARSAAASRLSDWVAEVEKFGTGKRPEAGCRHAEAAEARRLTAVAYCQWRATVKKQELADLRALDKAMEKLAQLPDGYDIAADLAEQGVQD